MKQSQKNCLILAHKNSCERQDGAITLFCFYVRKSVFCFVSRHTYSLKPLECVFWMEFGRRMNKC